MKLKILFLGLLLAFALKSTALAQPSSPPPPEPLILTDEQGEYPLGLYLEILEDSSGNLTIDQVSSPEFDSQFTPSQVEVPNFGFTDSAYWVRFRLDNLTRQTNEWLLEQGFANTHFVDLYSPLLNGEGFTVKQSGVLRPVANRDVLHPRIIYKLNIPPQSQQTYYLRFQNGASMTLPLTLWTQEAFLNDTLLEQIANGIFFGVLIGLLVYNLFLLFSLREANYLYFVILLASLIFEESSYDGLLVVYITPNMELFKQYYQPLFFALLIASMIVFSDSFLEIKPRIPKLHRINIGLLAYWGMLAFLSLFARYRLMATLMATSALLSLLVIFIAGIASWLRGFRPARFFMIAWLGLLASLSWVLLVRLGLTSSTLFSENAFRLGYLWMAVCWSIALADRINLLKAETEVANRELSNSEHRLSQILEGLPIGVVVYGKDQRPTYGNQRTIDILSNPARSIRPDISAGRTLAEAVKYYSFRVAGNDHEYPLEKFPVYRALRGELASADDIEADLIDKRVPLEIWASPVRDSDGNIESAVVALQDITQRKEAAAELDAYRHHLEHLVEQRTLELSAINEQLNQEATERKMLERFLYQRIEWLSALNQMHQSINGVADLPQVYEQLSAKIIELLSARVVLEIQWDTAGDPIDLLYSTAPGESKPDLDTAIADFQKDSPLRKEIELGKLILLSSGQADPFSTSFEACFQEGNFQTVILAPMSIRQAIVGVLGVALPEPRQDLSPHLANLVKKMALDLADLKEDAIFLEQARALVAAEERNRLARDLHDSVTQILFSASMMAEVLPQIWQRDPTEGREGLLELRRLTRGALAEMRTLLIELRPSAIIKTPLSDLLTQLTEAATSRTELEFQLYIEKIPILPAEVQIAFYRVAQEALNNVTKHAKARQVNVSLSTSPAILSRPPEDCQDNIKLVIGDDGLGYESNSEQLKGLGLGIMKERASAIDASLEITSQPGKGTTITLLWCR